MNMGLNHKYPFDCRLKMEVFSLILGFAWLLSCDGRPDGAPTTACTSLTPVHSGIRAQQSQAPYSISVSKVGNKVRVRIFSSVGEEFEGFVLQARYSRDRQRMAEGQFTAKEGATRTIDCSRGRMNTLTQVNPSPKREIVTEWTPRNGEKYEDIIFRATVAKTFAVFWTEIDSDPIRIQGDSSVSGRSERREEMNSDRKYDNCFVSKGCFGLPAGCINSRDCEVLLSYNKAMNGVSFKLDGMLEPDKYMAVGISRDSSMGDDFVTECVRTGQSNNIGVRNSFNDGKANIRTTELSRSQYDSAMEDGMATCTFTADYLTEFNSRRFNLENSTYYLLLAKGPMRGDRISYHDSRIASQEPVNFTAFQMIESEGVSDAIKVHGLTDDTTFLTDNILNTTSIEHSTEESLDSKGGHLDFNYIVLLGLVFQTLILPIALRH